VHVRSRSGTFSVVGWPKPASWVSLLDPKIVLGKEYPDTKHAHDVFSAE
jgi:hypothetical protein